jgi:sugar-specific transcriptional regulator TrmB
MNAVYLGKNEIKAIRALRLLVAKEANVDVVAWKQKCSEADLSRQRIAEIIRSLQRKGFVSIDESFNVHLTPLDQVKRYGN